MSNKIVDLDTFNFEPHKDIIGLCQGCFDLLHIGHIKHLQAAKKLCDKLIVAVTSDQWVRKGPGRPLFNQDLRMEQLASLEMVDYVVLSDSKTAVDVIKKIKPDIYIKGSEYEDGSKDITGDWQTEKDAIESVEGQMVFTHEKTFSSSEIINKVFSPLTPELKTFIKGGTINQSLVDKAFEDISKLKVLVIGDAISDEYIFTKVLGSPSKQSVISSHFQSAETYLGGAIATARHIYQVCPDVTLMTSLEESTAEYIDLPFRLINLPIDESQEIRKQSFLDDTNHIIFKVVYGDDTPRDHFDRMAEVIASEDWDIVVINDFGHGLISNGTAEYLLSYNEKFIAVNTQTNSLNRGYNLITKYKQANYVSIDMPEARLAIGDKFCDPADLANELDKKIPYSLLSITQGKRGTRLYKQGTETYIPVFSTDIVDTTGAGDAYFAITSLLAKVEAPPEVIGFIGNAVGSLTCRVMGNSEPLDAILLKKYIKVLIK